jgi:hypothetical protein
MAWESRHGRTKRFYYRSKRVGGQVRKVYLGRGEVAVQAAAKDAAAKAKRAAEKAELARYWAAIDEMRQLAAEIERGVDQLTEATLLLLGFHQHHGQWRQYRVLARTDDRGRRTTEGDTMGRKSKKQLAAEWEQERLAAERQKAEEERQRAEEEQRQKAAMLAAMTPLERAIYRARQGDPEGLPDLQKQLDANPEVWQHHGNLAMRVQESWLKLIAGNDPFQLETLRRHLDATRNDLAGAAPSPLERLLADRIAACYVQVLYFEAHEANPSGGQHAKFDKYQMSRHDQANRQYLAAIKMLATVRQLVAKTATIQVEMIHRSVPETPKRPIIGGTNGEQPRTSTAEAVNGHNRVNDPIRGVLDPIIAGNAG